MSLSIRVGVAFAVLSVSACSSGGGGGGDGSLFDQLQSDALAFEALTTEVDDWFPTAERNVPLSGTATFTGQGGVFLEEQGAATPDLILLVGDARLTADFTDKTVTGSITNMLGGFGENGNDPDPSDVSAAQGRIDFGRRSSTIGEDNTPAVLSDANQWASDFQGTVRIPQGTIEFDGVAEGVFKGNRPDPAPGQSTIRGTIGAGVQDDIRLGGRTYTSGIAVVAKNN